MGKCEMKKLKSDRNMKEETSTGLITLFLNCEFPVWRSDYCKYYTSSFHFIFHLHPPTPIRNMKFPSVIDFLYIDYHKNIDDYFLKLNPRLLPSSSYTINHSKVVIFGKEWKIVNTWRDPVKFYFLHFIVSERLSLLQYELTSR